MAKRAYHVRVSSPPGEWSKTVQATSVSAAARSALTEAKGEVHEDSALTIIVTPG